MSTKAPIRICKAYQQCEVADMCRHGTKHEQTTLCMVKCCDRPFKQIRCISTEEVAINIHDHINKVKEDHKEV